MMSCFKDSSMKMSPAQKLTELQLELQERKRQKEKGQFLNEWDTISVDSNISSVSTQGVSDILGPDTFMYWLQRRTDYVRTYCYDKAKLFSDGPERWRALKEIQINDLSHWILGRYDHDQTSVPQMTVEEIEQDMGIQRPWYYGNKPTWDWLFPGSQNASLCHVFPMYHVDVSIATNNMFEEVKKSLQVKKKFKVEDMASRSAPSVIGRSCDNPCDNPRDIVKTNSDDQLCRQINKDIERIDTNDSCLENGSGDKQKSTKRSGKHSNGQKRNGLRNPFRFLRSLF